MSAPPAAEPRLLHDLDAELLEAFGVRFDLWVKDSDWSRAALDPPGGEGPVATDLSPAETTELLRGVESSGFRPQVRQQSAGRYLLAIPLEELLDRPLVATTTLAAQPDEQLRGMAALFAGQAVQRRRWEEARASLEAYAEQATGDFEEITFLRSLAEHLDATQAPEHFREVAESVLTDLVDVIKAEALVWIPCAADGPPGSPAHPAGPMIRAGNQVVDEPTTLALVESLGPDALQQPAVRNYLDHQPGGEPWPGVRDLILVRVAKDEFAFGWLLALNRRREEVLFSSRYQLALSPQDLRDWRLSDLEFGTVEAGLMASTAAMLATHLRHVELLREKESLLVATDRAKSEFLANMSHELRTPLTSILGFAETLFWMGDLSLAPSQRLEAVQTILRNGDHLLHVIDDVLDVSKIESGRLTMERVPVSPSELVAEVVSLMGPRAEAKGIRCLVECASPLPATIESDPTRLRQILINLVGNAIKFTESGSVRLRLELHDAEGPDPTIEFAVIDTGIGMSREQVEQVFQPFVQADTSTTRRFGGTGLGLTISKRLAQFLGGDLACESRPDQGSTFRITLPTGPLDGVALIDRSRAEPRPAPQLGTSAAATDSRLEGRVLLVEDAPDNQRLIRFVLEHAGADVELAENGQVGIDKALAAWRSSRPYDVILMDMQMPVVDGYTATRRLREEGYDGPIVGLTAHAMPGDRDKCLQSGCNDYAAKPIDRETLLAFVSDHLGRR